MPTEAEIEAAAKASTPDALTFRSHHGLAVDDKVSLAGDTNAMRRLIEHVCSDTVVVTALHVRPSRGFASHVRRAKKSGKPVSR